MAVLALIVGAIVAVANLTDSTKSAATRTRSASGPSTRSNSSRVESSPTTRPPTTRSSELTTARSAKLPVALEPADRSKPPDPPVGYYRQGKLYLEGSVPTAAAAAGYARKAASVIGSANVIVDMNRDPRAPAGPLRVIVEEQFQFPTGSSALDPKFAGLLAVGADALKKIPESTLVITGYTDNVGAAVVNQSLSEQRAQLVVNFMVMHGIPANRIIAIGRGEADPIASNATPAGRQKNRRIEGTLEGVMPS